MFILVSTTNYEATEPLVSDLPICCRAEAPNENDNSGSLSCLQSKAFSGSDSALNTSMVTRLYEAGDSS